MDGDMFWDPADIVIFEGRLVDCGIELANFGYPGYAYLKSGQPQFAPDDFLLIALSAKNLGTRTAQGLIWVPFKHFQTDWIAAFSTAQERELQNRLGFAIEVAQQRAAMLGFEEAAGQLSTALQKMEPAPNETTLCHDGMTKAERNWLRNNRPETAKKWNILSDLLPKHLAHVS